MEFAWIPRSAQRVMPWKNGGGSTREVALAPSATAGGPGFRWRVSVASVVGDGPFSPYPGVDRSLWLLRGNGMLLDVAGTAVRLDRPLQRYDFAGETPIHARLIAGPNEDLNVMTERATTRAVARIVELAPGGAFPVATGQGIRIVLVLSGGVRIADRGLEVGDAVRVDGEGDLAVIAGDDPAAALVVAFVPMPAAR